RRPGRIRNHHDFHRSRRRRSGNKALGAEPRPLVGQAWAWQFSRSRLSLFRSSLTSPAREKVFAFAMRRGPRLSIGTLMRLIALFALELAMFQRVLFLVVVPPITMAIVSLNLAVLYAFRWLPPTLAGRIAGLLSGGLISIFVLVGYYVATAGHNP